MTAEKPDAESVGLSRQERLQDATFFRARAKELRTFAKSIEQGDYSFDPLSALEAVSERLSKYEPLSRIRRVAQLCAKHAPLIDSQERIKEEEVAAHWKLAYLTGAVDWEALKKDARRISERKLRTSYDHVTAARKSKEELSARLRRIPDRDVAFLETHQEMYAVVKDFQKARQTLLYLVGAKGQLFDPREKYANRWRRVSRDSLAMAVKSGRGMEPNAKRAKAEREAKGWSQAELARRAGSNGGGNALSAKTIGRLEAGERVSATTLAAVAKALGLELADLKA